MLDLNVWANLKGLVKGLQASSSAQEAWQHLRRRCGTRRRPGRPPEKLDEARASSQRPHPCGYRDQFLVDQGRCAAEEGGAQQRLYRYMEPAGYWTRGPGGRPEPAKWLQRQHDTRHVGKIVHRLAR